MGSTTDLTIVLDLDSTLICTQDEVDLSVYNYYRELDVKNRLYSISFTDDAGPYTTWGMKRIYLPEFLKFCFEYFAQVIVWTAGTYEYGHAIVDAIFDKRPHRIYTREDCVPIKSGPLKDRLSKPISKFNLDPRTTLTLDDTDFTAIHNPNNLILCPAYEPVAKKKTIYDFDSIIEKDQDRYLYELKKYLLSREVMTSSDVRELDKVWS